VSKIKLKTRKAASKRVKITGTGKVMRNPSGKKHLLSHRSSKVKRKKRGFSVVSTTSSEALKGCLPGIKIKG